MWLLAELTRNYRPISLKNWIEFVESLPPQKFRFDTWKAQYETPTLHVCTTAGCAAGWLPFLWPQHWHWSGAEPGMRHREDRDCEDYDHGSVEADVADFFEIPIDVASALVIPNDGHLGDSWASRVKGIPHNVSPRAWANHARRILAAAGVELK